MSASQASSQQDRTFFGHPRGLATLFNVELWERFSYYGMRAILLYYIVDTANNGGLGIDQATGEAVVAIYGSGVYLLSVVGGWAADRIIGARRAVLYGGIVIMAGHVSLAMPEAAFSWLGICLVALGTGFLKPNVSTLVGHLYDDGDPRRDGAFQIFYMSVNIGAFFSPLVVGFLRDHWGYHAGFAAAAVGMGLALVAYLIGRRHLGDRADDVPNPIAADERSKLTVRLTAILIGSVAILALPNLWQPERVDAVIDGVSILAVVASIAFFWVMFTSHKVTDTERRHLSAYVPLWIGAAVFFMIFEQAASKMAAFAENRTNLSLGGMDINPEWYQSVNPLAIVVLSPLFAWLWTRRAGQFPGMGMKFAFGVALAGLSFIFLGWASDMWPGATAPAWVLAAAFIIQTVGELCLSPVGVAITSLLAPRAFASQAMALWFLTSAVGQAGGAQAIKAMEGMPDTTFFLVLGGLGIAVSLVLLLLTPWVGQRVEDVERKRDQHHVEPAV